MNNFKPCPKCNSVPEYIRVGDFNQYWYVICPNCLYSPIKENEARSTKLGARLLWNRKIK